MDRFLQAPIGAKISVTIVLGARHVGRKFSHTEVIEFSRKRGGWNIVSLVDFADGKSVHVKETGYCPSQHEMLANMRKYQDRIYSVGRFNCDDGAEVLTGNPPKSDQRTNAVIGAGVFGLAARALGADMKWTFAAMGVGAVIGLMIANR